MHPMQEQIEIEIEKCTHWLREEAGRKGCLIEHKPRPGRGLYDFNWQAGYGEPPVLLGQIRLRPVERGLSDAEKRRTLLGKLAALLTVCGSVK